MKLTLEITDLTRAGEGVAKDPKGRVIFVPYTAPGDVVEAVVTKSKQNFFKARVTKVITPSSLRVDPLCKYFGECGGCDWQHLPYEHQWEKKVKGVRTLLEKFELGAKKESLFPAEFPFHYRNRVYLHSGGEGLGFYKKNSKDLVSVERCEIASPRINEALKELSQATKVDSLEIIERESGELKLVYDQPVSAQGFTQVNSVQNEKLKAWIRGALQVQPKQHGVDLFGGDGNLTRDLQGSVEVIDVSQGISVEDFLRESEAQFDFAVVDPPRAGLGKSLQPILDFFESSGVQQWILVGCKVDSWIRDLVGSKKGGWELQEVALFDFFPQTAHVESAALMRRAFNLS